MFGPPWISECIGLRVSTSSWVMMNPEHKNQARSGMEARTGRTLSGELLC